LAHFSNDPESIKRSSETITKLKTDIEKDLKDADPTIRNKDLKAKLASIFPKVDQLYKLYIDKVFKN
jgi:hypothetical protein